MTGHVPTASDDNLSRRTATLKDLDRRRWVRALRPSLPYVGTLLRETRDVQVTLFHMLKPMPRELLEHGGSEDPAEGVRLAKKLDVAHTILDEARTGGNQTIVVSRHGSKRIQLFFLAEVSPISCCVTRPDTHCGSWNN